MANHHRTNMLPHRANMMPPSISGPNSGPGPSPGPRDRIANLGAPENGMGSQPSAQSASQVEVEESHAPNPNLEPREGNDGARRYK